MTTLDSEAEAQEVVPASLEFIPGSSESNGDKTAETFLELLGARVRSPNTRSVYRGGLAVFLGLLFGA